MPVPDIPSEFDELSTEEKIEYVQRLWDRIAEESESAELTEEQRAELNERLQAHRDDPQRGRSWEEIRDRLKGGE